MADVAVVTVVVEILLVIIAGIIIIIIIIGATKASRAITAAADPIPKINLSVL